MSELFIDWKGYGATFLFSNLMIISVAFIGRKIGSNRKRYKKLNFPESYIEYRMNFIRKFFWRVLLFIMILEVFFSFLYYLILGKLGSSNFSAYILIPSLFFAFFFAAYYATLANGDYKKMAEEEGHDIVVDFQRKYLKEIFSLPLEIAVSLLCLAYTILFLPFSDSTILYLYIAIPWFFGAELVLTKNYIRPMLRDSYGKMGKLSIIYQVLLLLIVILGSLESLFERRSTAMIAMFSALLLIISVKILYYIPRYKRLMEKLDRL